MINYVLKKLVKDLNTNSLSAGERAVMRSDFLAKTGLHSSVEQPSIRSSFVLSSSKSKVPSRHPKNNFKLEFIEDDADGVKNNQESEAGIQHIEDEVMVKVYLDEPFCTPETCVILKIAPSDRKMRSRV